MDKKELKEIKAGCKKTASTISQYQIYCHLVGISVTSHSLLNATKELEQAKRKRKDKPSEASIKYLEGYRAGLMEAYFNMLTDW